MTPKEKAVCVCGRRSGKTEAIKEFKREQMELGKTVRIISSSSPMVEPIVEIGLKRPRKPKEKR